MEQIRLAVFKYDKPHMAYIKIFQTRNKSDSIAFAKSGFGLLSAEVDSLDIGEAMTAVANFYIFNAPEFIIVGQQGLFVTV